MDAPATKSSRKRLRSALARAIACGTFLILPACHIPSVQHVDTGLVLPKDYKGTTTPENSASMTLDDFFKDPILTRTVVEGVRGNQELKILEQDIRIAQNEILMRRGAYLPFVTFNGTSGIDRPSKYTREGAVDDQVFIIPGRRNPKPLPDIGYGLNFFWQLDVWRELRNARDSAIQRYMAAVERQNYFMIRLVADIADNYYQLRALDARLEIIDQTITLQEKSLKVALAKKEAGLGGTELAVQRFQAEVKKNQSEKLLVQQDIIEAENRINFLLGRYPQPVERAKTPLVDLDFATLNVGVPAQLLHNRPDIRQAERELAATGLDVLVARARFFPRFDISAAVGYRTFDNKYLFVTPEAIAANLVGNMVAPLINRAAIQADYQTATAQQLQAVFNYQKVVLEAFTEVINRMTQVENYRRSIEIKKQQLEALGLSVAAANKLFDAARAEYSEVLFAQRELQDARLVVLDLKRQQLSATINAYQALGGGALISEQAAGLPTPGVPSTTPTLEATPPVPAPEGVLPAPGPNLPVPQPKLPVLPEK